MKKQILTLALLASVMTAGAQTNENEMKTVRLIYPQWQGARIAQWIPELKESDATTGYYLGAELLGFLAPANPEQETLTVPVTKEIGERLITDGVTDRDVIARQTEAAVQLLDIKQPDRIITLGGECSASAAPFTWLLRKYDGDVALVWIDAHPDITLPGDVYPAYHAMAVTAMMGLGDKQITSQLPAKFDASKILFAGLCDWERDEIKARQQQLGIAHVGPADLHENSERVIEWLRGCDAKHVVVHFDMDVIDKNELHVAVGESGQMKVAEVVRLINDIAREKDLVGLTIAEPMPRHAIRVKNMLEGLPLMK